VTKDEASRSAALVDALASQDPDALVHAALVIATIEHGALDPSATVARLEAMGRGASSRLARAAAVTAEARVDTLNGYFFDELGFSGNEQRYDDPRNSFINDVIERRTGIPISLSLVYIDVARRAGVTLEGVNFPGHFLVRYPARVDDLGSGRDLLIDPFHRGALLSEPDCWRLLERHLGSEAALSRDMLATADDRQILIRMLTNLKRLYVRSRSFTQALEATDLLVVLDRDSLTELRDRGLLAYQLRQFPAALRDLEHYLQALSPVPHQLDEETRKEYEQIWEHVKSLRRRLASFN
jgi:regulator of sirC expression with transglutaminase-like and TPR domain